MKTEGTNLLLLTIDEPQKAEKYPINGRYRQVSLYIVNIMTACDLATQGARASASMGLKCFSCSIPAAELQVLT